MFVYKTLGKSNIQRGESKSLKIPDQIWLTKKKKKMDELGIQFRPLGSHPDV